MSDHIEHACSICGSLIHHSDEIEHHMTKEQTELESLRAQVAQLTKELASTRLLLDRATLCLKMDRGQA